MISANVGNVRLTKLHKFWLVTDDLMHALAERTSNYILS